MTASPRSLPLPSVLGAILALVAVGLLAPFAAAGDEKPPKPKPKPKLELLTASQAGALEKKSIKIGVESKRGDEVRVKATLTVSGIPEPYVFALKPQTKPLKGEEANVRLTLSARQREVLAFAEQACMGAKITATGKVGKQIGDLKAQLRKDPGC